MRSTAEYKKRILSVIILLFLRMQRPLIILLLAVAFYCSTPAGSIEDEAEQFCIVGSNMTTTCADNQTASCDICSTLNDLEEELLTDNSVLVFYNGTHNLNYALTFENLSNIRIIGKENEENPVINCTPDTNNESTGLQFLNVSQLSLKKLEFVNCGVSREYHASNLSISDTVKSALIFQDRNNLSVSDLTVRNSLVAAINNT